MRHLGIYKAPDGTEYVASKGPDGMYFLFDLHHWVNYGAVGLRVNEDGSISKKASERECTSKILKIRVEPPIHLHPRMTSATRIKLIPGM